jgi:RHS repeat-associated protein
MCLSNRISAEKAPARKSQRFRGRTATGSYSYDLRGRRVLVDDPDAGVSTTVYDVASQVVSSVDGRGETLGYGYDGLGRKTVVKDGSGAVLAEWVFDTIEKGYLSSSTRWVDGSPYTVRVYGYDHGYRSAGEIVTVPASEGVLAGSYTSLRMYYPDGSLDVATEPQVAGLPLEILRTRYDVAGNPEWMFGERTYVADTVWSEYGLVAQYSLGVNLGAENYQSFSFEEGTHRLAGMRVDRAGVNPVDADITYSYDAAGNPTRIADAGGLAGVGDVQCYRYDHHRRLTGAWAQASGGCAGDAGSAALGGPAPYGQSYSYDTAGNRTQLVDHQAQTVTSYEYPAPGQAGPHALTGMTVTGASGTEVSSFGYDDAGNTTHTAGAVGDATYGWDAEGRMHTAATSGGDSEFVHTADGTRLIRRDPDATTLYVFGTEIRLDHATQTVTGSRYYTFNGAVLAMREGTSIYTLGADLGGTPTITINNTTHTATTRRFDPFGNPRGTLPHSWPGDRGYHTGTHDPATGLIHLGARQHHPQTGRFLSVDPLINPADSQQVHGYAYANNNPLTYTDPTGLMITECDGRCNTGGGYGRTAHHNKTGTRYITDNQPKPPPRIKLACLQLSGLRTKSGPFWKGEVSVARKRSNFTPEFREEAARLVVENNRAIAVVARELGLGETTLGNWVKAYREKHAGDEPALELSERARLRELERRNRELEMENTFLKKAAAYFAREQR